MSHVYSKTTKGQEEIKTRAGGLSQRMRQVLIFIDGKRSRDDLFGMLKGDDMDALLAELVTQGLVEVSGAAAAKVASTVANPTAAIQSATTVTGPPSAGATTPAVAAAPKAAEVVKPNAAEIERKQREEEAQAELAMARSFMGRMS